MAEVEFYGDKYELRTGEIDEYAVYEFAEAVSESAQGGLEEMASIRRLLREQCVAEKDWGRFWSSVRKNKAKTADFFPVIQARMEQPTEQAADRPTERSSDSSDGPSAIEPKSESSSVEPDSIEAKVAKEFPGRPDKQGVVLDLQEWLRTG